MAVHKRPSNKDDAEAEYVKSESYAENLKYEGLKF